MKEENKSASFQLEGPNEIYNPDGNALFKHAPEETISIKSDRLLAAFLRFSERVKLNKNWENYLGIAITLLVVIPTVQFRDIFFAGETWRIIFGLLFFGFCIAIGKAIYDSRVDVTADFALEESKSLGITFHSIDDKFLMDAQLLGYKIVFPTPAQLQKKEVHVNGSYQKQPKSDKIILATIDEESGKAWLHFPKFSYDEENHKWSCVISLFGPKSYSTILAVILVKPFHEDLLKLYKGKFAESETFVNYPFQHGIYECDRVRINVAD